MRSLHCNKPYRLVSVLLDTTASEANDLNWRSWSNLKDAEGVSYLVDAILRV